MLICIHIYTHLYLCFDMPGTMLSAVVGKTCNPHRLLWKLSMLETVQVHRVDTQTKRKNPGELFSRGSLKYVSGDPGSGREAAT